MLKGDDGKFLKQLTDLIFEQNLTNALSFFDMKDSEELRLYYEFQSAGMAAFIIKWILDEGLSFHIFLRSLFTIIQTSLQHL